jgi:hypothetical protein
MKGLTIGERVGDMKKGERRAIEFPDTSELRPNDTSAELLNDHFPPVADASPGSV